MDDGFHVTPIWLRYFKMLTSKMVDTLTNYKVIRIALRVV